MAALGYFDHWLSHDQECEVVRADVCKKFLATRAKMDRTVLAIFWQHDATRLKRLKFAGIHDVVCREGKAASHGNLFWHLGGQ